MSSELVSLIRGDALIGEVAAFLDALDPTSREREATALGRRDQARLFEKAADAAPIRLSHFVPEGEDDLVPVHHSGRNTIATLRRFQRFQKRFARPRGEPGRLFGYNASRAFFIAPGYFVAYETGGREDWEARGGVVVDYHRTPDAEVPPSWPAIVPNARGLQRFVYHLTRDFMRRVSDHVSIGRASRDDQRGDRILDTWFTLCRQEAPR